MTINDLSPQVNWDKYRTLALERSTDGVLLITITEPTDDAPAMLSRRHTEIASIWRDFGDDPDLRVAVITGEGDRFLALDGTDGIGEVLRNAGDYATTVNLIREGLTNVNGMVNCDKPIVSAINGTAMGTGLAVALTADISVASTEARLVDGHLLEGIAAGDHAVMSWPLMCGLAKAKLYLLASEDLTGAEAERIGLVSLAVPPGDVLATALRLAHRMAAGPQHALRWTKRSLNLWLRTAAPAFEASMAFEALSFLGPDVVEALKATSEGRAPTFAEPQPW
jgi:enoyl-CoA hydratase